MAATRQTLLPLDVVLMISERSDHLGTLSNIIEVCPSLLTAGLLRPFDSLISKVLGSGWPEELCSYALAVLQGESRPPTTMEDLKVLMDDLIEDLGPWTALPSLPRTHLTLKRLVDLTEAIDFFVYFCATMHMTAFPVSKELPLSTGEEYRIRRALLRLQLYAQVFHQTEATDELVSDRDWEQRPHQQQYFWTRFTRMEVEECKCIYELLATMLSELRPIRSSTVCHNKSHQRGLPLLYSVFSGTDITPLAASYTERFVGYAFTGFEKVDPHDGNYFLPYRDFQNEKLPQVWRHMPSDAQRERNFGVKIYNPPMKYRPVVRQSHRFGWRSLGYCFWDDNRVDCMLQESQQYWSPFTN